jgi:hypothetical protein
MFIENLRKLVLQGEFANSKTSECGDYINNLTCPECGEDEAWAYTEKPLAIICNRQNNCGVVTKTIPLFNLVKKIEEKYSPLKNDPHRPARAYLAARGIPDDIIEKINCKYVAKARKGCGGAVMFPIGKDKAGKLYNGRLFNPPTGEGKTHNIGSVSGEHWEFPDYKYNNKHPIYVTEGILDALSLFAMGFQAIAILGAGYNPGKFDLSKFGNLVFAFDNDKAGKKFTHRWLEHYGKIPTDELLFELPAIMPISGVFPASLP